MKKRPPPGTSAQCDAVLLPCSWLASSTHTTVPFVPAGTGRPGVFHLGTVRPGIRPDTVLNEIDRPSAGIPSFLSLSISTFLVFVFHIFFLFCTRFRQPLPDPQNAFRSCRTSGFPFAALFCRAVICPIRGANLGAGVSRHCRSLVSAAISSSNGLRYSASCSAVSIPCLRRNRICSTY